MRINPKIAERREEWIERTFGEPKLPEKPVLSEDAALFLDTPVDDLAATAPEVLTELQAHIKRQNEYLAAHSEAILADETKRYPDLPASVRQRRDALYQTAIAGLDMRTADVKSLKPVFEKCLQEAIREANWCSESDPSQYIAEMEERKRRCLQPILSPEGKE